MVSSVLCFNFVSLKVIVVVFDNYFVVDRERREGESDGYIDGKRSRGYLRELS